MSEETPEEQPMSKEQLLNIKSSLPDARKQVQEMLTGNALHEALKRYDALEIWADTKLAEMDAAEAMLQPVSDKKRMGFIALWKDIISALWNRSDKKKLKKIRKFIDSREKSPRLSIEEMHSFAGCCAEMGNHKGIAIRSDAPYWRKFQVLLSAPLAVTNMEAMESLTTILLSDYTPETLPERVEKEKVSLAEWWGIYDSNSAVNTIYWLLQRGHAGRYGAFFAAQSVEEGMEVQRQEIWLSLRDEYAEDINFPPSAASLEEIVGFEVDKYMLEHRRSIEAYLAETGGLYDSVVHHEFRQQMLEAFLERHASHVHNMMVFVRRMGAEKAPCLNAWDIGRCANVVRWSYTCGYISEADAWKFLERNARRAVDEYSSFDEFAHDYMMGRFFWQGGGSGVDIETTYRMMETFKNLFDSQIGMWARNPWVSSITD